MHSEGASSSKIGRAEEKLKTSAKIDWSKFAHGVPLFTQPSFPMQNLGKKFAHKFSRGVTVPSLLKTEKTVTSSQIHSLLLGDKVDYGIGLSNRPAGL